MKEGETERAGSSSKIYSEEKERKAARRVKGSEKDLSRQGNSSISLLEMSWD